MAITVGGLGSGLDVNSIVEQLVEAERAPKATRLDIREAQLSAQLSSFGNLKSALAEFQTAVSGLASSNTFSSTKVSNSNGDLFTATASSIADAGDYTVEVHQLAQAHAVATPSGVFSETSDVVGTGTLTIELGTTDYDPDSDTYNGFTPDADLSAVTIEITESNNTLVGLRDAINASGAGVQASIVNDGDGYRLLLRSEETGADRSFRITVADDDYDAATNPSGNTDSSGLSLLAFNESATNLEQTRVAQDAQILVDGLAISSSSNTVTGAIDGVTLNLKSADPTASSNLTVTQDRDRPQKAINGFVAAFNNLVTTLDSLTDYNPETEEAGALIGDSTVRNIESQLRREISSRFGWAGSAYRYLSDVGISTTRDGTLEIDQDRLSEALESDLDGVTALFTAKGRASDSLIQVAGSSSRTQAGRYDIYISQLGSADGTTDVAGTIGGVEAMGSGNLLYGTGAASGLVLEINGGSTGERGTVEFTRGFADRLNTLLSDMLDSDEGLIASRLSGLEDRIADISEQRQDLNEYIADYEARTRAQFQYLDSLMAELTHTSNYLSQQLETLPYTYQKDK